MSALRAWDGSTFVDGSPKVWNGSAFVDPVSAHIWNGSAFQTVWTAAEYDAVGAGTATAGSLPNWNHTAAAGADVFVVVSTDRSGGATAATYGGVSMSLVASATHNADSSRGSVQVFHLAGAGNGSAKAVSVSDNTAGWMVGNSISFTGVVSAGTPTTATGSNTSPSQSVSGFGLQLFSVGNGGVGVGTLSSFSGVTNRSNLSSSNATRQAISTAAASGTASATLSSSAPWAAIFIPL